MIIPIAIGAWALGSVLLGLLLGGLFGVLARRRRAEQELFAWFEEMRRLAALRKRAGVGLFRVVRRVPGLTNPTTALGLGEEEWLSYWAARQGGRTIQ
jgi:hypothetical protein